MSLSRTILTCNPFVFIYLGERLYLSPYFKFVRDTLSYIVLVVLHYALCLSPSTVAVSGLEWAILTFFVGRYLVERQQIWDIMQHIKRRKKKGDVGAQSKWIRLKTLSVYLRYMMLFLLQKASLQYFDLYFASFAGPSKLFVRELLG